MLENGFIALHRKIINWGWYRDINTKTVFLHLLLTANYEDMKWQGITVKRGQRVASFQKLADEIGLSKKTVYKCIKKLETTHEVEHSGNARYTVFTVVKYSDYQDKGTQRKRKGNAEETQGTHNETIINKANKDNKEPAPPGQILDGYVAKRKF